MLEKKGISHLCVLHKGKNPQKRYIFLCAAHDWNIFRRVVLSSYDLNVKTLHLNVSAQKMLAFVKKRHGWKLLIEEVQAKHIVEVKLKQTNILQFPNLQSQCARTSFVLLLRKRDSLPDRLRPFAFIRVIKKDTVRLTLKRYNAKKVLTIKS